MIYITEESDVRIPTKDEVRRFAVDVEVPVEGKPGTFMVQRTYREEIVKVPQMDEAVSIPIKVIRVIEDKHSKAYYENQKQDLIDEVGESAAPFIEQAGW